jgi:alpha-ketoglutarate-dependent 2,4-dichlorophenoxyacetate dioxygenase
LDDTRHVNFGRQFGELDDVTPYNLAGRKNRLQYDELFDVSNLAPDGSLLAPDSSKSHAEKANIMFHCDSSFNPRRAGYSLLLAHELPPTGTGGSTAFADTRTAYDDLPAVLKEHLVQKDYIADHNMWHSRKLGSPEFFHDLDPSTKYMSRHRLIQRHEPSGRMNMYIASHLYHIEDLEPAESTKLFKLLYEHAQQPRYTLQVDWKQPGDLVVWDNTSVMHRAMGGTFGNKYRRDMRRVTVHDGSSQAWGLNEHTAERQGLP